MILMPGGAAAAGVAMSGMEARNSASIAANDKPAFVLKPMMSSPGVLPEEHRPSWAGPAPEYPRTQISLVAHGVHVEVPEALGVDVEDDRGLLRAGRVAGRLEFAQV